MNTEQLKNFLSVADVMNFRRASEKIYIAQPALSRQIQQLEEEIGAQLFDRSRRQIRLTRAGEYFRLETQRILAQLELAGKKAGQIERGEAGEIRIGHVSSAMQSVMPPFLKQARINMPGLKVSLMEGTNRQIFQRIEQRELDFGVVPNATTPGTNSRVIYREDFVLVTPFDSKINRRNFRGLEQFSEADWILPQQGEGVGYSQMLYRMIQNSGFNPKVAYESPNASTSLRLVEAGLGVTLIGKSALKGMNLSIKHIVLDELPEKVEMRLVWLKERETELGEYLKLFLKLLKFGESR